MCPAPRLPVDLRGAAGGRRTGVRAPLKRQLSRSRFRCLPTTFAFRFLRACGYRSPMPAEECAELMAARIRVAELIDLVIRLERKLAERDETIRMLRNACQAFEERIRSAGGDSPGGGGDDGAGGL